MADEQDGKIENASTPVRLLGKETTDSTQPKCQVTTTEDAVDKKCGVDVAIIKGSNPGSNLKSGRVSIVSVPDNAWVPLPATALPGRVALGIQNESGRNLEVKYVNTGAFGTGMLVESGDRIDYDLPEGVVLFGRLSANGPRDIRVEELAE